MENLYQIIKDNDYKIIGSLYATFYDISQHITQIKDVDIVIVNGEGTIHDSNAAAYALTALFPEIKRIKNIPIALVNTSYYRNNSDIAKNIKYCD